MNTERTAQAAAFARAVISALVSARQRSGQSQTDVARALGISQATYQGFESGRDARMSTLFRYADAMGAHVTVTIAPRVSPPIVIAPEPIFLDKPPTWKADAALSGVEAIVRPTRGDKPAIRQ